MKRLLLLCLLAACGGESAPPATPPPAGSASTTALTPAPSATTPTEKLAWKTMNHDQRAKFMKDTVMPKMSEAFQAFDGKHFADFSCKTCHGESAVKDGSFKMPNPSLPKLPMDHAKMGEIAKKKPDAMKFMAEKVKPEMAALLGEEPWDEKKAPNGFGCGECHEMTK